MARFDVGVCAVTTRGKLRRCERHLGQPASADQIATAINLPKICRRVTQPLLPPRLLPITPPRR